MYVYNQMPYYQYYPSRNEVTRSYAEIKGSRLAPNLRGYVVFTNVPNGTDVYVEVAGLPPYQPGTESEDPVGPHGFHIHENGDCSVGDPASPFQAAGGHWNPTNQPHGNHAGDFPVLFSNDGYARMSFFTNTFNAADVIGKAVIIHQNPDDYRTQPAGDAGKRIGCGVIQAF
ncbi:superoxide dismutase family protein [Bacillus piscicola]|uniref:superoxide dismutase family protein n=1 Tax=Bacillus piscicola TaxID=1632684 RepID=UPI001F097D56|nr:superoxide dismutase family protein [Bacillus piscicola]